MKDEGTDYTEFVCALCFVCVFIIIIFDMYAWRRTYNVISHQFYYMEKENSAIQYNNFGGDLRIACQNFVIVYALVVLLFVAEKGREVVVVEHAISDIRVERKMEKKYIAHKN